MTDNRAELVVDGHRITVIFDTTYRFRKTRIHVSGTSPDYDHPPYSMKGDDPENDKAWRKYNRDEIVAMRELLDDISGWLQSISNGDLKYRFSRKAGCSCGCSPGFIADRALFFNGRAISQISIAKAS